MKPFISIAIDGGAGSGKSTTAHHISSKFNFLNVDTGSHYRSITAYLIKHNISEIFASKPENLNKIILSSKIINNRSQIQINGSSFSHSELRSKEINLNVSKYSSIAAIRSTLFDYQKSQCELARQNNFTGIVMEGRDIGTIILPDADLKLFLFANENVRNQRRREDGESDLIEKRDLLDSTRTIAPLSEAENCVKIDTSKLTPSEVVTRISKLIDLL